MNRLHLFLVVGLAACLTACATAQPYWENQRWAAELFQSVEATLHYPPEANPAATSAEATVQFTYADGKLQDAEIMKSTGSEAVDAAILEQIGNAKIRAPLGMQGDVPHRFQMDVHMTTPLDTYQAAMQRAISRTARYPQGGGSGKVSVSFDYLGGKVYNVKADHPSGSKLLDGEALKAVIDANLPQTPDALKGITHFVVGICFGSNNFCGHTQTVIQVVNDPGTTPAANR